MAVRFLKRGKDISILENEVKVMRDMREAGLDVPEVLILPDGKYILTCDSAPANAVYDVDHSYRAIIYKATPKLFIYPEDIKHPDDMEMLALNSIGQFAEMLKKGFIHTSLSPLSHSEGLINPWRWNHKPLGGVENMEEAAAKSNIRLGGVNDFEHVRELSAGESAYDETVQAVCEWTVVVTYHSLKNGIPEEKTTEILKVGFDKLANVMGYGVPGIETIRTFVSNFHKEFKKQDIPFQNTAEAPVFDELVALVTSFVKKPHIGRNGLPMGPGAANITEPLSDSPAQEPRAVIFDIGKVLIDFDHGRMANALAQYSPHSASEILDIMEKSEATRLIRIGKISTNEFIARIKQEAALDIDSEEFLRIYNDQFTPKQDMIDFAFRLKRAGYKVAALSTISAPHYEHILRLLPAIQKLDGVFVSCKLGMAKPDPKIYEYVLEELGIAPHEAIFVDDVDENVTGARGSGMTAIKFAGYEALKTELEDLAPSREQNIALDFKDTLISKAYAARDKKETIILALDESWIPLYSGATGLIEHIGRYVDALNRRLGYEGVVFVSGKAEAMASEIARIREDKKAKNSNIIVLCKNDVLSAGGFNVLKGTSEDDSALLVGVNPANLKDISGVRIVEMFMLAMELNSGRDLSELDQTFIDIRAAGGKRMFVFTPIKPYDIGEFKKIYDLQIKALDINA
jgi:putative hydrolase of the HAD superfamily